MVGGALRGLVFFGAILAGLALSATALGKPAPGSVLFRGDFETGDLSQWTWGAQCANTGVPSTASAARGTIHVQSAVAARGKYAARIDLPAARVSNACETLSKRTTGVGTDDYYGLTVRFPRNWREPSPAGWGLAIAQLNFQNIWGSPVSLVAHANQVALVLQSGRCNSFRSSRPGCRYSSGRGGNVARMVAVRPLTRGTWHQLIVHVRWTTERAGVVEVWHRTRNAGRWRKTVSVRGYPTLQWTADRGPAELAGDNTSDKIGAYRGHAGFPLTIWHNGFVRASSFAAAVSALR